MQHTSHLEHRKASVAPAEAPADEHLLALNFANPRHVVRSDGKVSNTPLPAIDFHLQGISDCEPGDRLAAFHNVCKLLLKWPASNRL